MASNSQYGNHYNEADMTKAKDVAKENVICLAYGHYVHECYKWFDGIYKGGHSSLSQGNQQPHAHNTNISIASPTPDSTN